MLEFSLINSVSFVFCEFYRVGSGNESKTIILVDHHFKFPNRTLVSYSRSTNVNVNMSYTSTSYEGNFSTYVFVKSF